MAYYVAVHPNGSTALWYIDNVSARRADGAPEVMNIPPGADVWEVVKSTRANFTWHKLKLGLGEYYPRMARPNSSYPTQSPGANPENASNKSLIETSRGQLVALREQLERIFRVVQPAPQNFDAYGHEIRNLLLLAATEVESHCKGVLKANGRIADNTNEYVKLAAAMKLDEYAVRLPFYPWLDPVRPFQGWSHLDPTKSLPWYAAYHAVKHNRESEFEKGTLLRALEGVCGCAVMLFAQFGTHGFHYREQINSFFELAEAPKWDVSEVYAQPHAVIQVPKPYPF